MAGIQILVVEDDPRQAKLVSFLLEEAGHTVEIAESAEKALEILQSFRTGVIRPNLILMDLQLPRKDGLELTRELRRTPIHDSTPIIALTAYTDPSDLAKAREAGCTGIISKPIDTASFARQVRNCLGAPVVGTEVPSDSGDFLTEMRNNFLAEGLDQCGAFVKELEAKSVFRVDAILRTLHRWAGIGGTLGFPEISNQARKVEALLNATALEHDEVVRALETARRRFRAATRREPELPLELIRGLMDVRIGLVSFSAEEANRIQMAASRANVHAAIEQANVDSIDHQSAYGALVINECGVSAAAARNRPAWSIPAVFIGSRASLESLARLPSRAFDFVIAPWEAEEILTRVYRLIRKNAPLQPAGEPLRLQRRRPRVLVADDDPDLVALVSDTLGQFGMDCDVARSGQQALDTVSRRPPDAILLDVNMVDVDGFEILKKLRRNLATSAIPVLLLTARSLESDITRGFGYGADDYVVKPFNPSDLGKRVDKMITASRQARLAR
jgi:CheY-like chemotaxis protein